VSGLTSSLVVGQYLPADSPLHRLDPRGKLIVSLTFAIVLFLVDEWVGLGVLGLGLLTAVVVARTPLIYLWRGLRPLLMLLLLTFFFQALSYPGTPVLELGPLVITGEGLSQGGFLTLRLAFLLVGGTMLTLTTSPVAITDGIEWLLSPLRRIGVPSAEIALMMTIALRFIPTLLRELEQLLKAQRARGADLRSRNPRKWIHVLIPLVVPLFVLSFRRADDLAVAMTSRCYRGGEGRTRYREMAFAIGDVVFLLLVCVWLVTAWRLVSLWG